MDNTTPALESPSQNSPDGTAPMPPSPPETFASRLASLPQHRPLTTLDLMWIFGCSDDTITRAVTRNDLPPPVRMMGHNIWTVAAIHVHIAERLDRAKQEAARTQQQRDVKIKQLYGGLDDARG